ncbi:Probable E3 ubiquitin-protein ligase ARI10 (ARIADNE-like protein ARI10) (Protein ariadne homolog 10) (RING-type E3 ubiquitin transferase ARI10) [Durusdinium trenchii]|uniref:RBR-type E3 ubiquitin transferase n=1 Tax=Durusdinium trenchii TaxID=1381693 RepID=A0ABP0KR96_9DINO
MCFFVDPLRPPQKSKVSDQALFCRNCWRQYLRGAVLEGKGCLDLRCPAPSCKELVRPSLFMALLEAPLLERYQRFLTESLVDDSRGKLRWCPGVRCRAAAQHPGAAGAEVSCRSCGTDWCFLCGNDVHRPVTCDTVKRWEEKNRDEGCDVVWIKANTKLCPKCQNPIATWAFEDLEDTSTDASKIAVLRHFESFWK